MFNEKIYDVRNYGAVGDGKTMNTQAVQRAIDECAQNGGGRVEIFGGTYLCGSIELKSYVELHISANAVLLGSAKVEDYPERKNVKHVISEMLPRARNACFIFADECEHIALTGEGVIDCNGHNFVRLRSKGAKGGWKYERIDAPTPPRVVFFTGCSHVKIEDVIMQNQPAGWSYWIHDCDYVTIDKIKICADVNYPNNDGIHINCSRNVTVSDCDITCGDDSIIVRANSASLKENKVCEKVCVTNCNLTSHSSGVRVGWTNDGIIRNCTFSNLVMTDTIVGIGIYLPGGKRPDMTDVGREETEIENLSFNNIVMNEVRWEPIRLYLADHDDETLQCRLKSVKNIYFSNLHVKGPHFFVLQGRKDCNPENICFNNCDFEITDGKEIPKTGRSGRIDCEEYLPLTVHYVKGLKLNNVEFKVNK